MVELLNKIFKETFVLEDYGPLPFFEQSTNEKIYMISDNINYENSLDRLKKSEINKSFGADILNPAFLKKIASALAILLTLIFKKSLEKSLIPLQLRLANDLSKDAKLMLSF